MLKISSSCVLLTALVFSSANAPTFRLWHDLPSAAAGAAASVPATNEFDAHASTLAYASYALTREYDEANDLERFELDELFLPKLDVTLPELFDWSDGERTYLASNSMPLAMGFGLDRSTFHSASASRGFGAGGGSAGGGAGKNSKSASGADGSDSADSNSVGTSEEESNETGETASNDEQSGSSATPPSLVDNSLPQDNQLAKNDPPLTSLLPPTLDPSYYEPIVDAHKPAQVPAPATFGLFVLGLAALRFVGRKKNGSG